LVVCAIEYIERTRGTLPGAREMGVASNQSHDTYVRSGAETVCSVRRRARAAARAPTRRYRRRTVFENSRRGVWRWLIERLVGCVQLRSAVTVTRRARNSDDQDDHDDEPTQPTDRLRAHTLTCRRRWCRLSPIDFTSLAPPMQQQQLQPQTQSAGTSPYGTADQPPSIPSTHYEVGDPVMCAGDVGQQHVIDHLMMHSPLAADVTLQAPPNLERWLQECPALRQ